MSTDTVVDPISCFAVGSETLQCHDPLKNGSSASNGDSFTHGTDVLVYDLYTGSGNQTRTLRFENRKWIDHNTSDEPVMYDGNGWAASNVITETSQNPQTLYIKWYSTTGSFPNPYYDSSWSSGGGGGGFLSNNPKIENLTFTKTSDVSFSVSFDWENLSSYTVTNSRNGVLQTASGNLSGSSGSESSPISLSCQDGDLLWIHGDTNYDPLGLGSQGHPYVFRFVNFSISGTTLTMSTFFHGSTGLNNDADFRVWDPSPQSWVRLGYVNYDGNLQTDTVTPFERGKEYYIVDRSTGNDYGSRYTAPGTGRRTRGRTFW